MSRRLRDQPDDLLALTGAASRHRGIDPAFVEKDFWATEVLRAVGRSVKDSEATVILKGGTSLSKAFGIVERFSEDIDVLLVAPGLGAGRRDRELKRVCEQVGHYLGCAPIAKESTKGVKRNVRYAYPRHQDSGAISESVLLELGTRGGPHPNSVCQVRSYVADYAVRGLDESLDAFDEFAPVDIHVLNPERTLIEKLSLIHDLAARMPDPAAQERTLTVGRHLYDVYKLLNHDGTKDALRAMKREEVETLADDVAEHSRKAGWLHTARPAEGFAASPAFDPKSECQALMREAYSRARDLVWGDFPDYSVCVETVLDARDLL